jgi:tetratricopeptide (TPR) repeat protein
MVDGIWLQLLQKAAPIAARAATPWLINLFVPWRVAYSMRSACKNQGIGTLRYWALRSFLASGKPLAVLSGGDPEQYPELGHELVRLYRNPPSDSGAAAVLSVENLITVCLKVLNLRDTIALQGGVTAARVSANIEAKEARRTTATASFANNLDSLPLLRAEEAIALRPTWPAIERFAQEFVSSEDRQAALRSWYSNPPSWFGERPSAAIAWFALLANDYGEKEIASTAIEDAIAAGASPAGYWRSWEILSRGVEFDEQARLLRPFADEVPIAKAVVTAVEVSWESAAADLAAWEPQQRRDQAMRAALLSQLIAPSDLSAAIEMCDQALLDFKSATCAIIQARLLIHRGGRRTSAIDFADLVSALEVATTGRDIVRSWHGPSGRTVTTAVSAARLLGRFEYAWQLTQSSPEGVATAKEVEDPAVRQDAALLAAAAGKYDTARALVPPGAPPQIRHEINALSAIQIGDAATELLEWEAALSSAHDHEDIARICLHIALLGARPSRLDALGAVDADFASDVRLIADAYQGSGEARTILRARSLASRTLARSYIGLLTQRDEKRESADVAERAGEQWSDPEFVSIAAEQYLKLGEFEAATRCAERALRIAGPVWESWMRASGILIDALLGDNKWQRAMEIATEVLSRDSCNTGAAWVAACCQYQLGRLEEAWRTYTQFGRRSSPRTDDEALVLIDLWRRFEGTPKSLDWLTSALGDRVQNTAVKQALTAALFFVEIDEEDQEAVEAVRTMMEPLLAEQGDTFIQRDFDPDNPIASLTQILDEFHKDSEHDSRLDDGQLPIGMASTIHRRSLTEVLARMTLAPIFAGDHETYESEIADVVASLGKSVVVDLTALYALSGAESTFVDQMLGTFLNPEATRAQLIDSIQGCDVLSRLSTLSVIRGPDGSAQPISISDDEAAEHFARATRIRELFSKLGLYPGVEIEHFDEVQGASRSFFWLAALDHAIGASRAFWCDDRATRAIAKAKGLRTFGTHALIEALRRRGAISDDTAVTHQARLVRAYFVGLDFKREWLEFAGTVDRWAPKGAACFIANCAPASDPSPPLNYTVHAIRQVTGDPVAIRGWVAAASKLLIRMAGSARDAHSNLVTLMANLLQEQWLESSALPFVIAGVRDGIGATAVGDPLAQAIEQHYRNLVQNAGWAPAAQHVWNLIQLVDPRDRATITGVILGISGSN